MYTTRELQGMSDADLAFRIAIAPTAEVAAELRTEFDRRKERR